MLKKVLKWFSFLFKAKIKKADITQDAYWNIERKFDNNIDEILGARSISWINIYYDNSIVHLFNSDLAAIDFKESIMHGFSAEFIDEYIRSAKRTIYRYANNPKTYIEYQNAYSKMYLQFQEQK